MIGDKKLIILLQKSNILYLNKNLSKTLKNNLKLFNYL